MDVVKESMEMGGVTVEDGEDSMRRRQLICCDELLRLKRMKDEEDGQFQ